MIETRIKSHETKQFKFSWNKKSVFLKIKIDNKLIMSIYDR